MTTVYFIRHAESDTSVRDGRIRPLTQKGLADCKLVTDYLQDKNIDIALSSPFKRAIDTISDFVKKNNLVIETIEDFREQKSSENMGRNNLNHYTFLKNQWKDFSYALSEGESLLEVQKRNVNSLKDVLLRFKDKNIIIGTHGTALSTIINYYDNKYSFNDFMKMVNVLPWVVKMDFDESNCVNIKKQICLHRL